ncbi:hypothetical protein SprV_0702382400 [Sparganum proliferum]
MKRKSGTATAADDVGDDYAAAAASAASSTSWAVGHFITTSVCLAVSALTHHTANLTWAALVPDRVVRRSSVEAGKTKVSSGSIPDQEKAPLRTDGCQLEEVDSFKYLGARLLPTGQSKDDIVSRIDAARWVFSSLRKCLWIRRYLSIATKIRVYRASVRSVLLYGCECWALRVEDERKLEVFDHHCLRTILRVKFTDFVSNETVRARCNNITRITQAIQERRLRWFEHVLRRPPQELSVTVLDPAPLPYWRRRSGGQFKTWLDTVRQDMEVVLRPSVFGLRRWRRGWVVLSRSAAADRHRRG